MKMHSLSSRMLISGPLKEVFSFFERPENLARITPSAMRFKILTPGKLTMRSGAVIDYTVRIMGIDWHWRTLITDYDPPRGFVDIQLQGPYSIWHHTHRFEETEGGTLMTDEVAYALPLGPVGRLVHPVIVRPRLDRIFDYRRQMIGGIFGNKGTNDKH